MTPSQTQGPLIDAVPRVTGDHVPAGGAKKQAYSNEKEQQQYRVHKQIPELLHQRWPPPARRRLDSTDD